MESTETKRKPTSLTMEEWARTPYAEVIFSATRGPDSSAGYHYDYEVVLKMLTTARIRSFISDWKYGAVRAGRLYPEQLQRRDEILKKFSPHFAVHYHEAVTVIKKVCGYDLEAEQEITEG